MSEPGGDFSAYGDAERAAGQKSPDAFRTISEVSADLDVPQHVLRFWEGKFAQIRPLKRGGGRRYYRPDDMDLLRGIQHLLYGDGYTIKGVQKLLREHGVKYVVAAGRRVPEPAKTKAATSVAPALPAEAPAAAHDGAAVPADLLPSRKTSLGFVPPPLETPATETARYELAARLFGKLKTLRREYDLKLQAAKNGR
jgi:DNA-binding transcriptional MerR regulator